MILRRIAPLSLAKVFGLLYALLGLLIGAVISLLAVVGALASMQSDGEQAFAFLFGAGAFVVLPIVYGLLGAIGGLITAVLYNLVARVVGGVEVDLEPKTPA